jgi:hypothetical protein
MADEQIAFVSWETSWAARACPVCNAEDAVGHGWLFMEPKPRSPQPDIRKVIAEVFAHDGKEDCQIRPVAQA